MKWGADGKIHQLAKLEGDTVSFAFGINEEGQAVGARGPARTPLCRPMRLRADRTPCCGKRTTRSPISARSREVPETTATSINDRGEVVGTALLSDGTVHAFLWSRQRGMQELGLPGDDFVSVAGCCQTINNRGEVVDFSFPGPLGGGRAIVWVDKVTVDLNTLIPAGSPWYLHLASSINDAGEIVGWGTINGEVHAFLATPR